MDLSPHDEKENKLCMENVSIAPYLQPIITFFKEKKPFRGGWGGPVSLQLLSYTPPPFAPALLSLEFPIDWKMRGGRMKRKKGPD